MGARISSVASPCRSRLASRRQSSGVALTFSESASPAGASVSPSSRRAPPPPRTPPPRPPGRQGIKGLQRRAARHRRGRYRVRADPPTHGKHHLAPCGRRAFRRHPRAVARSPRTRARPHAARLHLRHHRHVHPRSPPSPSPSPSLPVVSSVAHPTALTVLIYRGRDPQPSTP